MLSVLIPARNEIYLEKTIQNVLENAEGEIEVLVALDGYKPDPQIVTNDNRVIFVYNKESIGQRQSVNMLAKKAKGDYLMKLDAHCAVDKGFDVKLIEDYVEGEVHLPRMYNLDKKTWLPKKHKRTDYMYIGWNDKGQLRSLYYKGRHHKEWHRKKELLGETMGIMGPCRFMSTKTFWDLGGCDEGHGSWGSEGIEWACKAWLSGGRLIVNKKTWFAHWFRGGDGGFPYSISGRAINRAREHAENLWLNDGWEKQKRPFKWMIDKFDPPSWGDYKLNPTKIGKTMDRQELFSIFYKHIHREKNLVIWKGVPILKMPSDLIMYSEVIQECKPDHVVEIGTKYGGSALYFQDMLDMNGTGTVTTIDIKPQVKNRDTRINYIVGDSTDKEVIEQIEQLKGKIMLVIDGNHSRKKVKWELHHYSPLVSSGQYMVVEDCYIDRGLYGPGEARDWFMERNHEFIQKDLDKKYLVGITMGGWLKRI